MLGDPADPHGGRTVAASSSPFDAFCESQQVSSPDDNFLWRLLLHRKLSNPLFLTSVSSLFSGHCGTSERGTVLSSVKLHVYKRLARRRAASTPTHHNADVVVSTETSPSCMCVRHLCVSTALLSHWFKETVSGWSLTEWKVMNWKEVSGGRGFLFVDYC